MTKKKKIFLTVLLGVLIVFGMYLTIDCIRRLPYMYENFIEYQDSQIKTALIVNIGCLIYYIVSTVLFVLKILKIWLKK